MTLTQRVHDYWNAESCGTRYTDESKFSLEYFEEIENYRYDNGAFIHGFAQFTRWHGKTVLEVGVGAGTDFLQWARAGAIASGCDLTAEGVDHVRHRLAVYGLSADIRVANAENLPFANESFDLVYSFGVIHHAENTERCFQEIVRVAKPGGRIKVMVYNINSIFSLFWYLRRGIWAGGAFKGRRWAVANFVESPGTKAYTEREMCDMVDRHGCRVRQVHFFEQEIRDTARLRRLRRFARAVTPQRWLWFMALDIDKPL